MSQGTGVHTFVAPIGTPTTTGGEAKNRVAVGAQKAQGARTVGRSSLDVVSDFWPTSEEDLNRNPPGYALHLRRTSTLAPRARSGSTRRSEATSPPWSSTEVPAHPCRACLQLALHVSLLCGTAIDRPRAKPPRRQTLVHPGERCSASTVGLTQTPDPERFGQELVEGSQEFPHVRRRVVVG